MDVNVVGFDCWARLAELVGDDFGCWMFGFLEMEFVWNEREGKSREGKSREGKNLRQTIEAKIKANI